MNGAQKYVKVEECGTSGHRRYDFIAQGKNGITYEYGIYLFPKEVAKVRRQFMSNLDPARLLPVKEWGEQYEVSQEPER